MVEENKRRVGGGHDLYNFVEFAPDNPEDAGAGTAVVDPATGAAVVDPATDGDAAEPPPSVPAAPEVAGDPVLSDAEPPDAAAPPLPVTVKWISPVTGCPSAETIR